MTNETAVNSFAATAIRLGDGTEIDIDQYSELLTTEICKQIGAALQADFMAQLSSFESRIAGLVANDIGVQTSIRSKTVEVVTNKLDEAGEGDGSLASRITERVIDRILNQSIASDGCGMLVEKARQLIVAADERADRALASSVADALLAKESRLASVFATAVNASNTARNVIAGEIWKIAHDQFIEEVKHKLICFINDKIDSLMSDIRDSASTYRTAANTYKAQRDMLQAQYEDAATNMQDVNKKLADLRRDLDALADTVTPIECPEFFPAPTQPDRD